MVQFAISDDCQYPAIVLVGGDNYPVKVEIEDSLDDEHGPIMKKQKQFSARRDQLTAGNSLFPAQASQYNPLDEPSPLGLRLRKSPSLLELIQMRLSQGKSSTLKLASRDDFNTQEKPNAKNSAAVATDKLKASNFPASILRIGSWEYSSKYEGDLVGKCYFAKHKLVWEVLKGGLKSKIEIQWSDIKGLKADLPDDAPATLIVVVSRQPLFFRETNPQPRKHTLWQATPDFTDGQASLHRNQKYLWNLPTLTRSLLYLMKPMNLEAMDLIKEKLEDIVAASVSQPSSISIKQEDAQHESAEILSRVTASPSSVMDIRAMDASTSTESGKFKNSKSFEQLIMQGIRPSISMTDLVNHIENCISSENLSFIENDSESQKILEDIAQHLLGDFQFTTYSDEKSLMSRVNSLCSLIQKDSTPVQSCVVLEEGKSDKSASEDCRGGYKRVPSMARIDSFGDLLLQLPRIASLPKFLFDISEDGPNQAR